MRGEVHFRVQGDLRVHVFRAQPIDHHEHQRWRHTQLAHEAVEVLLGVAGRAALHAVAIEHVRHVARPLHQQLHVFDRLDRRLPLVPIVGDDDALAHRAVDARIEEEQQDTIEVEALAHDLLALVVEQYALHCLLQVHAVAQVRDNLDKVLDVNVDRLEEVEQALDSFPVHVPHLAVARDELGRRLDLVLEERGRLQVRKVHQQVRVQLLLGLVAQRKEGRHVVGDAQELGDERLAARTEAQQHIDRHRQRRASGVPAQNLTTMNGTGSVKNATRIPILEKLNVRI